MKILIIGSGSIGKRHIKNLQLLGYSDITCLKRTDDLNFSREFNVNVIVDLNQIPNYEVVFICTPSSLHYLPLKIAVENNLHVFVEKPLLTSEEDFQAGKILLENYHKGVFFIGYMLRYHSQIKNIKRLIDNNIYGRVYYARFEFGSFLPNWHPKTNYKNNYAAKKDLGGGVLNTICHEVDLIQFFFGEPNRVIVLNKNNNILEIDVEEVSEAILDYPRFNVSLHLDFLQKKYKRQINIYFEKGELYWDWDDNKIIIYSNDSKLVLNPESEFDLNALYIDEVKDFLMLIEKKQTKHALDKDYALRNTDILLKLYESNQKNSWINNG